MWEPRQDRSTEDYGHRNSEATYQPRMENSSSRAWTRWLKCLLCKHEDLNLICINHVKKLGVAAYADNPGHWEEVR